MLLYNEDASGIPKMKRLSPIRALAMTSPAYAGRDDFGVATASVACTMLDTGISGCNVERASNRLERNIINSSISEREQLQIASGFNFHAARNTAHCDIEIKAHR